MKILHIVPSYKPAYIYGGTIESVARLCEGLAHAGHDVTVYTTTANGDTELEVIPNTANEVEGVRVFYFERVFKDPFYISPRLSGMLKKEAGSYDIIHIHSWWNMLVMRAAAICKQKGIRFVLSPHGMFADYILSHSRSVLKWGSFYSFGKRLLKTALYHATSEAEVEECQKLVPGWKGFMIPNIVWLPDHNFQRKTGNRFTIIFLSRIHPKKGIELLMQAVSRLEPRPLLQIAGDGDKDYIARLRLQAELLGITGNVEWLGWQEREEKFQKLAQADLFALTSYNENFGNVVIEALFVGTPVVVSGETGLSGYVKAHDLGWVAATATADILGKLEEAILNSDKRKRIALDAPCRVAAHFSAEKLIPEYIRQYRS